MQGVLVGGADRGVILLRCIRNRFNEKVLLG